MQKHLKPDIPPTLNIWKLRTNPGEEMAETPLFYLLVGGTDAVIDH
ncbi:hypothetical protein [Methanosarcina horonobensis]